jgi:hypothetical protein
VREGLHHTHTPHGHTIACRKSFSVFNSGSGRAAVSENARIVPKVTGVRRRCGSVNAEHRTAGWQRRSADNIMGACWPSLSFGQGGMAPTIFRTVVVSVLSSAVTTMLLYNVQVGTLDSSAVLAPMQRTVCVAVHCWNQFCFAGGSPPLSCVVPICSLAGSRVYLLAMIVNAVAMAGRLHTSNNAALGRRCTV